MIAFTIDDELRLRSRKTRMSPNWRLASNSAVLRPSRVASAMAVLIAIVVFPTPPLAG